MISSMLPNVGPPLQDRISFRIVSLPPWRDSKFLFTFSIWTSSEASLMKTFRLRKPGFRWSGAPVLLGYMPPCVSSSLASRRVTYVKEYFQ